MLSKPICLPNKWHVNTNTNTADTLDEDKNKNLHTYTPQSAVYLLIGYYSNLNTPGVKSTSCKKWDFIGSNSIPPSILPASHPSICVSFPLNQTEKIGFSPESNSVFLPFPQSSIHSHVPLSLPDCENRIFPGSNSNYYITRLPLLRSFL